MISHLQIATVRYALVPHAAFQGVAWRVDRRGFALGALTAIALLGVGSLVAGAIALESGQPYGVYYPLWLLGGLCPALGFFLKRSVSKRYEQFELRGMQAFDA